MARGVDLGRAFDVWRKQIPDDGERVAFFRSELRDCESTRPVGSSRSGTKEARYVYRETARILRLLLAAEGVKPWPS